MTAGGPFGDAGRVADPECGPLGCNRGGTLVVARGRFGPKLTGVGLGGEKAERSGRAFALERNQFALPRGEDKVCVFWLGMEQVDRKDVPRQIEPLRTADPVVPAENIGPSVVVDIEDGKPALARRGVDRVDLSHLPAVGGQPIKTNLRPPDVTPGSGLWR